MFNLILTIVCLNTPASVSDTSQVTLSRLSKQDVKHIISTLSIDNRYTGEYAQCYVAYARWDRI